MTTLDNVLNYWFENPNDYQKWFMSGSKLDHTITNNFKTLLDFYRKKSSPCPKLLRDKLGLIILLDQFSRHIYRNDPKSFDMDPFAKSISYQLLESGGINLLTTEEQMFALMPLQHSEDIQDLEYLVDYLTKQPGNQFAQFLDYSRQHYEVIKQFGRYPKRNQVLGRKSTPQELQYLNDHPNRSF